MFPVAEILRVVLYAEGTRETGDTIALATAPGNPLPEERLGTGHVLLRRIIVAEKGLKQKDIRFDAPLRKRRGVPARGSDLSHRSTLRQLLHWASPERQPHVTIVLVDADGETQRKTMLEKWTEGVSVPHVIAVAVQEFEAWLIADLKTVEEMHGGAPEPVRTSEPERLEPLVAKRCLDAWLSAETDASSARRCIAERCNLNTVARACSSFAALRRDIRAVHC